MRQARVSLSFQPSFQRACTHTAGLARVFQTPLVTHSRRCRARVCACVLRRVVGARRATVLRVCIARTNRATLRTHYMRAYTLPRWLGSTATTRIPHNFFDVLVSIVIKAWACFRRFSRETGFWLDSGWAEKIDYFF